MKLKPRYEKTCPTCKLIAHIKLPRNTIGDLYECTENEGFFILRWGEGRDDEVVASNRKSAHDDIHDTELDI